MPDHAHGPDFTDLDSAAAAIRKARFITNSPPVEKYCNDAHALIYSFRRKFLTRKFPTHEYRALLAACRVALALIRDPDAEASDADAAEKILIAAIARAEGE